MTKKIGLLLLIGLAFLACKDDEAVFDAPVPEDGIRFEPTYGGAIMHYAIPENSDICAISASYVNELGEQVLMKGTPYGDTLLLPGFFAPHTDVPVAIAVTDNNDVASATVMKSFSTLAAAPYAIMDSVEVESSWNGIRINTKYEGLASGIIDIFHVGKAPSTGVIDTLYVSNISISTGENSAFVNLADAVSTDETTIVLRSEDGLGNFVRTKVFPGVTMAAMEQYPSENLTVSDPGGFSYEYKGESDAGHGYISMLGVEYLIDGDTKGTRMVGGGDMANYYTYVTNADAQGAYVGVELAEPQVIATIRLYRAIGSSVAGIAFDGGDWFNMNYDDRLPSHVRVWGTNDPDLAARADRKDSESNWTADWTLLGEFYQLNDGTAGCWREGELVTTESLDAMEAADPIYCDVSCAMGMEAFKYIRVETVDHFATWFYVGDNSQSHYISYHELEVFVEKEEEN